MTKAEIIADLEKAKRQLKSAEEYNIPAAIEKAKSKISKLEKDLSDFKEEQEEKKEEKKEVATEKKKKAVVKKAKKAEVKKQEAGKGKRGRKKHTKEQRVEKRIAKSSKPLKTIEYKGKTITEKDIEYCDAIKAAWEGRRAKAKKSAKKFKTKSITQKIGGDIAGAVVKAIKHVEHEDKLKIQKNPKAYVTKIEKIEMYANKLSSSFRDLLGEDYKSTQMKKEMDDIEKAIKAFVTKFKKQVKK